MPTCITHSDKDAVAYCRNCGRAMCSECRREVRGMVYCEDCLAGPAYTAAAPVAPAAAPAYTAPSLAAEEPSPVLALFLGFIPGVGAIYNGQYVKGFLHVIVLGILISLAGHAHGAGEPLFGLLVMFFWAYMVFEAYHTAKKRLRGESVDEWSGLVAPNSRWQGTAGALLLIALGVVFLLDTLNLIRIEDAVRYWPIVLIVAGAALLVRRLSPSPPAPPS